MAALAAASHPALYDAGWHPTAVCGAFGSDGKAIQVGLAVAAGVQAALLARGGARVDPRAIHGPVGFEAVVGARWPSRLRAGATTAAGADAARAIEHNWIKLYPSCLGTHSPIEAAALARSAGAGFDDGAVEVRVHPVARQAAHLDEVTDGLSAKFSIPYCVAHTVLRDPPGVRDFADVDPEVAERSSRNRASVPRPRAGSGCRRCA